MNTIDDLKNWLTETVAVRAEELDIPAASIAILVDGKTIEHAVGTLNRGTGVENTIDAIFQIGSITKVWTATLVMQLVDDGLIELDKPIRTYLPTFGVADQHASVTVTVRQLLTHTAGFEGDVFRETGVGDDALKIYIDGIDDVVQLFAPGNQFSYNNLAFSLLGRLVEVVREKPFDVCLREHILTPLGLTHAATDAYEAVKYRTALGHLEGEDGEPAVPAPAWAMMRSNAPAGAMLSMPPRELVAFAKMHLNDGKAEDGTVILSPESVRAMQERQVELPNLEILGNAWGLGWELMDTNLGDATMIGHDGNTIGQAAFLRVVPERGIAIAMLTNGGNVYPLYQEVFAHVLGELAGIDYKALPAPPKNPEPIDASRFVGTYGASAMDIKVSQDEDGRIFVDMIPKGASIEMGGAPPRTEYVSYGADRIISLKPTSGMFLPFAFLDDDGEGHARFLHIGRAMPRIGD